MQKQTMSEQLLQGGGKSHIGRSLFPEQKHELRLHSYITSAAERGDKMHLPEAALRCRSAHRGASLAK